MGTALFIIQLSFYLILCRLLLFKNTPSSSLDYEQQFIVIYNVYVCVLSHVVVVVVIVSCFVCVCVLSLTSSLLLL